MASALRPHILRHAFSTTSTRTVSTALRSHLPRRSLLPAVHRAAFQTTSPRPILPALPQEVEGTVNDPVPVPEAHPSHGSYHWTTERVLSAALLPLTVMPFAAGSLSPLLDGVFIGAILVHSHIGFQAVITDYIPTWRLPMIRKMFDYGLYLALAVVGWGWYEFETNDVGLTEGIRRVWNAKAVAEL